MDRWHTTIRLSTLSLPVTLAFALVAACGAQDEDRRRLPAGDTASGDTSGGDTAGGDANPFAGDWEGQSGSLYSWGDANVAGGDSSGPALRVDLTWQDPVNDQDLHLLYLEGSPLVCNRPYDCYYANKMPSWFPGNTAADPRMIIDDTNGYGPETIMIDAPAPGRYRVLAHYYADHNFGMTTVPTPVTLDLWLGGLRLLRAQTTLTEEKEMWAVADIVWDEQGHTIEPLDFTCAMPSCGTPGTACEP